MEPFSERDVENNAELKKHKKRWFLSFTENAKLIVLIDIAFLVKLRNLKKHYFSRFHEKWENDTVSCTFRWSTRGKFMWQMILLGHRRKYLSLLALFDPIKHAKTGFSTCNFIILLSGITWRYFALPGMLYSAGLSNIRCFSKSFATLRRLCSATWNAANYLIHFNYYAVLLNHFVALSGPIRNA